MPGASLIATRGALIVAAVLAWHWTQRRIGLRPSSKDLIGDGLFEILSPVHAYLSRHPRVAGRLLTGSSAVIDLCGVFLLASSVFGASLRPFVSLLIVLGLRQVCQMLCALPPPPGMIWRDPGFPSLFVTYGVANDFFFSGHTAVAVLAAVELSRLGLPWLAAVGALVALFEIGVVLALRAHYTMDVFAGVFTALYAAQVAAGLSSTCDQALATLLARLPGGL